MMLTFYSDFGATGVAPKGTNRAITSTTPIFGTGTTLLPVIQITLYPQYRSIWLQLLKEPMIVVFETDLPSMHS